MALTLSRSVTATTLFLLALPTVAHHSRAIYDQERLITIEGVVTEFEWANPHVYLYIETQNGSGGTEIWTLEGQVTTIMRRLGVSRDTFVPGDLVSAQAYPLRNSERTIALVASIEKAGVIVYNGDIRTLVGESEPSPVEGYGLSGIWEVPWTPFIGQFNNPSAWHYTAKGAEAFKAYDDLTMNPQIQCTARTAPWLMIFTGVNKIEIGDSSISIDTEYNTVERTIHMDVTSHDGAAFTHQGHSIGRWENEVLIVDTAHFTDHRNGNARGAQSGSQKHLVERFELNPDRTSLTYYFQLEDPEHLTAPIIGQLQLAHRPDLDFVPVACNLENAGRFAEG